MPAPQDQAVRLPDAEMDVMGHLWRTGRATVREIREALAERRPMTHASALTLVKRLEEKGLVVREDQKEGKAFIYRPTRSAEPTCRRVVRQMADRLFGGNSVALVASLLETRKPSAEELAELEQLLDRLRSQQGSKQGNTSRK